MRDGASARDCPRILLAWEAGAGRGHVVTLKTVAAALGDRCAYDASLCAMDHAGELGFCDLVFQGARLYADEERRHTPGAPRTATWGEFMGDTGFRNTAFLTRQVGWWQETMRARRTDLVVADYAPCALLAAQGLGVPTVLVGTGYSIPPEGLREFPVFLPEYPDRMFDEADMVRTINAAVEPLGVPRLDHLPDVYRRSQELVRTLDILDPYHGMRGHPVLPPVADLARIPAGTGEELFVYFSTTELDDAPVAEALAGLDMPVRAFCPGIGEAMAARLRAGGVMLEEAPVPVDLIASRSRLILHSGQHGILSLGLAAGVPQIAIPQHLEHLYHARRAESQGVCTVATLEDRQCERLREMIADAYESPAMRARARDVAEHVRPQFAVDTARVARERILPLLGM